MTRIRLKPRAKPLSNPNAVEDLFAFQLRNLMSPRLWHTGGLKWERQYPFAAILKRKWTLDFAWPALKLGVEINGGIWIAGGRGAHSRPANIERDMEKGNAATALGWMLLSFTPKQVRSAYALAFTETVMHTIITGEYPCDLPRLLTARPSSCAPPAGKAALLPPRRRKSGSAKLPRQPASRL